MVTEDAGGAFCRADAFEVVVASPDRVSPPCRFSGPGRCGGCDWQHAAPAAQRSLKAAVVAEQLLRLAGVSMDVVVEELAGGALHWRRRVDFVADQRGRLGLRRHRSHTVQPLSQCLIGAPGVGDAAALDRSWPPGTSVTVAAGDRSRPAAGAKRTRRPDAAVVDAAGPDTAVGHAAVIESAVIDTPGIDTPGIDTAGIDTAVPETSVLVTRAVARPRPTRGRRRPAPAAAPVLRSGPVKLTYQVDGRTFRVAAGGFWQPHIKAATTLTEAVLAAAAPQPGETVLDLYAGAGLFSAALADAVGATGWVLGVEGSSRAVRDAERNLAPWPWAEARSRAVTAAVVADLPAADLVVLDPPRTGAGRDVMIALLGRARRRVVYVACDPAALARDLRTALDLGWRIYGLRAFDAFPMTHHVECVCVLTPPDTETPDSSATRIASAQTAETGGHEQPPPVSWEAP